MGTKEKSTEQIAEYFMQKYGKLAADVAQEFLDRAINDLRLCQETSLHPHAVGLLAGEAKIWDDVLNLVKFNSPKKENDYTIALLGELRQIVENYSGVMWDEFSRDKFECEDIQHAQKLIDEVTENIRNSQF